MAVSVAFILKVNVIQRVLKVDYGMMGKSYFKSSPFCVFFFF